MAGTLSPQDFWDLVQHILPFYIILLVSYFMAKKDIIQKIHAPGLNRWTSLIGIPLYVGNMLAFNDPYEINLRLVGADALQKAVVLVLAGFWWRFSKYGCIDGVITFFMLATLSNMVLVGPALFQPLHGDSSKVSIATIIILQCALWYNLCIVLFETRVVLKEMNAVPIPPPTLLAKEPETEIVAHTPRLPFENVLQVLPSAMDDDLQRENEKLGGSSRLQRTTSAPARVSLSNPGLRPSAMSLLSATKLNEKEDDDEMQLRKKEDVESNFEHPVKSTKHVQLVDDDFVKDRGLSVKVGNSGESDVERGGQADKPETDNINRAKYIRIASFKVANRVKYAPLTYTSIIGFSYSLLANRYDWDMPYPIKTTVQYIANGAIAISVVTMAITWNDSGRLISCGVRKMTYGFIIRFLIGPIIMVGCALAFGLTGIAFEFAVLQAALPVGLVSFVLAKEYGLDIEVFATAVTTQLILFLPLVVAYYYILQPIGV